MKVASAELEFLPSKEDVKNVPHKEGFVWNPRFAAPAGKFLMHFNYLIGSAAFRLFTPHADGGENVEWAGLLSLEPVELVVSDH